MSHETTLVPEDDFVEWKAVKKVLADKIVHALTVWPVLSPSMLQVGIGTSVSPKLWHPILEQLIKDGVVKREEVRAKSPLGRDQVYIRLSLHAQLVK
jgi:hypothetical protein